MTGNGSARREWALGIGFLLIIAMLIIPGTTGRAEPSQRKGADWQDCGDGMQCADLSVPQDWDQPGGSAMKLGVARLPATDPGRRIGTLVTNLGGPGETITQFRRSRAEFDRLRAWFDIVAFDPRGFGRSGGVICPIPFPDLMRFAIDPLGEWRDQQRRNRAYVEDCATATGGLAGRLDADQVARDVEAVRVAVGDPVLHYFGHSYGTVYGQAYLRQFPDRVGRMFLDSVLDHTRSGFSRYAPIAEQVRDLLPRIDAWCAATTDCALHGRSVLEVWDRVQARAERDPIPVKGTDEVMTGAEMRALSLGLLTFQGFWRSAAAALARAEAGDAGGFDFPWPPPSPGNLQVQAQCSDFGPPPFGRTAALRERLKRLEPRLYWQNPIGSDSWCIGLPQASNPVRALPASASAPILISNGLYDLTTPPSDGRNVARQVAGSRWFGVNTGHGGYLYSGSRCGRTIVEDYLSTGALPDGGTICTDAPDLPIG